jgi:hypothetical protein
MHARRRRFTVSLVPAMLAALVVGPPAASAGGCGSGAVSIENGGFEVPGTAPGTFNIYDASLVPPWNTTDAANGIEVWGDGFNGVPAFEGGNFAELNANTAGTLYQDIVTEPGSTLTWTVRHRAREGTDVMRILIGDAATADVFADTGWNEISADISDDTTAWGTTTDDYVVPADQLCTRFAFRAVSTGSGSDSVGNFLDGIEFVVTVPASPTPSASEAPVVTVPPTDGLARAARSEPAALPAIMAFMGVIAAAAFVAARTAARRR